MSKQQIIEARFYPGQQIKICGSQGDIPIDAYVIAVSIRKGPSIFYEVSWWYEGNRHEEFIPEAELLNICKSREAGLIIDVPKA